MLSGRILSLYCACPYRPVSSLAASRPVSPLAVYRPVSPLAVYRPASPLAVYRPVNPLAVYRPASPLAASRPVSPLAVYRSVSPLAASRPVSPLAASTFSWFTFATPLDRSSPNNCRMWPEYVNILHTFKPHYFVFLHALFGPVCEPLGRTACRYRLEYILLLLLGLL